MSPLAQWNSTTVVVKGLKNSVFEKKALLVNRFQQSSTTFASVMLPKQNIPSNLDLEKWSANDDISTLKPNDQDINRMQTLLVSDYPP